MQYWERTQLSSCQWVQIVHSAGKLHFLGWLGFSQATFRVIWSHHNSEINRCLYISTVDLKLQNNMQQLDACEILERSFWEVFGKFEAAGPHGAGVFVLLWEETSPSVRLVQILAQSWVSVSWILVANPHGCNRHHQGPEPWGGEATAPPCPSKRTGYARAVEKRMEDEGRDLGYNRSVFVTPRSQQSQRSDFERQDSSLGSFHEQLL